MKIGTKWTEDCKVVLREDISYMVYYDLDREGYRTASGSWVISKLKQIKNVS